jgi:hypothetical protein
MSVRATEIPVSTLRSCPSYKPNGVPTHVPACASQCLHRNHLGYDVRADALSCPWLPRLGNAGYRETGIEDSNPSRSAFAVIG